MKKNFEIDTEKDNRTLWLIFAVSVTILALINIAWWVIVF